MNRAPNPAEVLELFTPIAAFSVGLTDIIDNTFATNDASDAEIHAIGTLIRSDTISTTELQRRSGLSRRARDRLVDQLLDDELVERTDAPHDHRVQLLTLTPRGRRRARTLEHRVQDYFSDSGELVDAIVAMIGAPADAPSAAESSDTQGPLDLVDRMAALGNTLDAAIRAQRAPKHPKNRDQLALLLIATAEEARPSRIAEQLNLTSGGFTSVLNRLETDDLIVRRHDQHPGDRRAVVLGLTPDGHQVVAAVGAGLASITPDLQTLFSAIAKYTTTGAIHRPDS